MEQTRTTRGTVLAYCEARVTGKSDWDMIDIFMRRSTDGGETWAPRVKIADVPGPKVKNPAALANDKKSLSTDVTWPINKVLEPGNSAYSDLAVLPDGTILCLYERGGETDNDEATRSQYCYLTLARFNLDWLTQPDFRIENSTVLTSEGAYHWSQSRPALLPGGKAGAHAGDRP